MWVVTTDNRTVNIADASRIEVREQFRMERTGTGGQRDTDESQGVTLAAIVGDEAVALAFIPAGEAMLGDLDTYMSVLREGLQNGTGLVYLDLAKSSASPLYKVRP